MPGLGLTQVLKIILYCAGLVLSVSVMLDRSPVYLISGLGAMTAVLMLVFKDPILGFVAGIQLISNRMLKNGDWIEMSKYEADGDVIDTDMTFIVRQLAPTVYGLPLEIYVFCKDKIWANYESIQSDIFDHLLAVAGEFDLRVYQYPSGSDLLRLLPEAGPPVADSSIVGQPSFPNGVRQQ